MKIKYSLLCLLLIGTSILAMTNWNLAMMEISTFLLAYLSKGMRRYRKSL
jgi:hypothetical protein